MSRPTISPAFQPSMRSAAGLTKVVMPVGIDAVDAVAGGAQDQLVLALDILEKPFGALPFGDAAAHEGRRPPASTSGAGAASRSCMAIRSHGPVGPAAALPEYSSVSSRPSAWRGCSAWVQ